jgi:hypothetical protein
MLLLFIKTIVTMNRLVLLGSSFLLFACASNKPSGRQSGQQLVLENTSAVQLTDKAIAIKRDDLRKVPEGSFYPLILSASGDTIPSQLDDVTGDNRWDELFFVADLAANERKVFSLQWVASQPQYPTRTSVRFGKRMSEKERLQPARSETVYAQDMPRKMGFQRYQTDGPSWENDKVGFRHYLDGRNAKDVFGKLVPAISPETVGINDAGAVEDNYHVMEDWGRDILAVGNSVGIGGVALLEGQNFYRLGVTVDDTLNNVEKTDFNILSEGPVRSLMRFQYNNWKPVAGKNYRVEETTSIWPGMYAYHNTVRVSGMEGSENLGIGMVSLNSVKQPTEIRVGEKWVALINHDKHTYNKEWWLGLALILPADAYLGYTEAPKTGKLSHSFFARMRTENNRPVNYYSVAAWELSDKGFTGEAYFRQYVESLVRQISAEVTVTVI